MGKKCFLLFFVILLCLFQAGYTPQLSLAQTALPAKDNSLEQVGAFLIELNAERLAEKLKSEGFEVEVRKGTTQDNKTVYKVFAGEQKQPSDVTRPSSELKQVGAFFIELNAERLAEKLKSEGFEVEVREGTTQNNETIYRVFANKPAGPSSEVASAQVIHEDTPPEEVPVTDKAEGAEEVVEKAGTISQEALPAEESGQVAAFKIFRTEADAEAFAQQLRGKGFRVEIHETQTKDKGGLYTVFAERQKEVIEVPAVAAAPPELSSEGASAQVIDRDTPPEEVPVTDEPVVAEEVVVEKVEAVSQEALPSGQVATLRNFRTEADAEAFAQQLREEGYSVTVNEPRTTDAPYTVFAKSPTEVMEVPKPSPKEKREPVEVAAVAAAEELKTAEAAAVPEGESSVLQSGAAERPQEAPLYTAQQSEMPQEAYPKEPSLEVETVETAERDGIKSKDIFGRKGGYIHPFLSITGYYTDNVFNQPVDEKSDFVTVLTPGIWLAVPGINQKLLSVSSSNTAPGGYRLSRSSENFFRRYQIYLLYNTEIELFSKYHSQNFTGHRIEGLFQYNLRGGLTFEFVDQYLISHDIIGTGIVTSDELDKFYTNLANPRLIYNTGKRWWFMVDYSNFLVKYNDSRNDFRHRDDNAISAYVFFRLQPKTSAFFQYQYIDVNYRNDTLSNSDEHNYYGGLAWDITAKSKGAIKAGYGIKDFEDDTIENAKNFRLELQINHRFTPKTNVMLNAWRRTDETNISTTDYILAHGIEFGYNQQFTGRLMGNVRLSYIHDHYKGDLTYDGLTQERKDSYYIGTVGLFYRFREWVGAGIGYTWTKRDSNFPEFEYTNNMFFFNFNISGSL